MEKIFTESILERKGRRSNSSDSSRGHTVNFKEPHSEPLKKVNLNPSSDDDLTSDSGVSVKSDMSNGHIIDISLNSKLQQRPDCPEHRGIMERYLADCISILERKGRRSNSSDSSRGHTVNFKETHSEPLKKVNLNPSSDDDLTSDSGVSVKSDMSNGHIIDISLNSELQQTPDCPEDSEMEKFYAELRSILERKGRRSNSSDSSRGHTVNFKEPHSEPLKKVNLNPSSDDDLTSDSGVSVKSDMSNGHIIDISLKRRRQCNYQEQSSPPSRAPTEGPRLQEELDLGLSTGNWFLVGTLLVVVVIMLSVLWS
ncbi:uncharacterized protein LOC142967720 [Anarhichas minor]|uniref:uncharacterized protein LOC142967720 n=1 Tax=Anarhichas minor TaxID=65739 RepID=UPI003F737C9C